MPHSDLQPPVGRSPHVERPRFQFSLRWLLIAVTIVAVLLGMCAVPATQGLVGLLLAVLLRGVIPTAAVVAAVYGRGDLRAFAIGAIVVCVPILTTNLGPLTLGTLAAGTLGQIVAIGICGSVAVATRRWIERQGG